MSVAVSWVVIVGAAIFSVIVAVAVHVALQEWDARAWERDIEDWKAMCRDLEPYDWQDE